MGKVDGRYEVRRGARSGVGWLRLVALVVTLISIFSTACGWRMRAVHYPPGSVTPAPVIYPSEHTFVPGRGRVFFDHVDGSTVYYTLDGSTPTTASTRYTDMIHLDRDTRVKAIAIVPGGLPSAVVEAVFTVR